MTKQQLHVLAWWSSKHNVLWNKQVTEDYIQYDFIYTKVRK